MPEFTVNWFPEELEAARPPARLSISEWAARYRILGRHSAIRGPYQLAMVPFFVPIMDVCLDAGVDEIVCCKAAQLGGTDAFLNVLGYFSDQDPSSLMVVLSDEKTAKYVSNNKITVMFKDSPHLRRLYDPKEFTTTEINLRNGGYIAIAWASSVAQLGTRSIRIVYFDEINKPGYSLLTKEADAISLGRERTNTYPQGYYKHLLSSTPTLEDGNISKELEACNIIFDWHVPCPDCGHMQPLRWSIEYLSGFQDGQYRGEDGALHGFGGVVWEGGRAATKKQITETARYACGECGILWTTQQKNEAVRRGRMVSRTEYTGFERKIGFQINRIYSLFDGGRLENLVEAWVWIFKLSGEKRRTALQGFVNSSLAEPWKNVVGSTTKDKILNARCDLPPQLVPESAVAITCGIDVQKRGFWFAVRAWARDYTSWLIHYGSVGSWSEVEDLLFSTAYPVQDDNGEKSMRIWRAAIDTGGGKGSEGFSMTEETYWWLRQNAVGRGCRVWGTKGSSRPLAGKIHVSKPLDKTPSGRPIPGGLQIIFLDTSKIKDMVVYRLNQAIDGNGQAAYLHSETGEDYARMILAEEKRVERGVEKWVQVSVENHLFDCECLCQIVAEPEWIGGGVNILMGANASGRGKTVDMDEGKRPWLPKPHTWLTGNRFRRF